MSADSPVVVSIKFDGSKRTKAEAEAWLKRFPQFAAELSEKDGDYVAVQISDVADADTEPMAFQGEHGIIATVKKDAPVVAKTPKLVKALPKPEDKKPEDGKPEDKPNDAATEVTNGVVDANGNTVDGKPADTEVPELDKPADEVNGMPDDATEMKTDEPVVDEAVTDESATDDTVEDPAEIEADAEEQGTEAGDEMKLGAKVLGGLYAKFDTSCEELQAAASLLENPDVLQFVQGTLDELTAKLSEIADVYESLYPDAPPLTEQAEALEPEDAIKRFRPRTKARKAAVSELANALREVSGAKNLNVMQKAALQMYSGQLHGLLEGAADELVSPDVEAKLLAMLEEQGKQITSLRKKLARTMPYVPRTED